MSRRVLHEVVAAKSGAALADRGGPRRDQRAATTESPGFAEKSHIISHGHYSSSPQNAAIPTMQIQDLKMLLENYVRNWRGYLQSATGPQGLAGLRADAPSDARGASAGGQRCG